MKNWLKKRFCLTEKGAKALVRATWACFFAYLINMAPMVMLMALVSVFWGGRRLSPEVLIGIAILILIAMYVILAWEYKATYTTAYKESGNLRRSIADFLRRLPMSYFSKHDLSDLAQTIMSDVEIIEHGMSNAVPKAAAFVLFFTLLCVMMLVGNLYLGIATLIPALFSFALVPLSKKWHVSSNDTFHKVLRANSESFQEAIELHQEISSFNMGMDVKASLENKMEESEKIHFRVELRGVVTISLSTLFAYISLPIVILVGTWLLKTGEIPLIYLIAYTITAIKVKELLDLVAFNILEIYYMVPSIDRIKEITSQPVQEGEKIEPASYDIEVKNIAFSYNKDHKVLSNISFVAKQGEVTALVGFSGCGKTSLLRLIARLYDYENGQILLGGQEIKGMSTESLFKNISIVFQDVTLFNTSIKENIRLGRGSATDFEVYEATRLAGCMDFIEKMPSGLDTVIGENGSELSGGERQRISIARALLKDAPILLLDEISANIDVENERKIQDSLSKLIKNKTVIIISHRLKSIQGVDKIVVLDQGQVESLGTSEELLETSAVYRILEKAHEMADKFVY